jgi:hypothetical protein
MLQWVLECRIREARQRAAKLQEELQAENLRIMVALSPTRSLNL